MSETTFQEQYDSLLEEKSAFQQAGMDAKVKEWDHKLECLENQCGHEYGANGSDIFQRKCPKCQGGKPGIEY